MADTPSPPHLRWQPQGGRLGGAVESYESSDDRANAVFLEPGANGFAQGFDRAEVPGGVRTGADFVYALGAAKFLELQRLVLPRQFKARVPHLRQAGSLTPASATAKTGVNRPSVMLLTISNRRMKTTYMGL